MTKSLPPLPTLDEVRSWGTDPISELLAGRINMTKYSEMAAVRYERRREHIASRGFVCLTSECVERLATGCLAICEAEGFAPKLLDAGAGSGYLAEHLARLGLDVLASDLNAKDYHGENGQPMHPFRSIWRRDHVGDAVSLLPGDFTFVLLSWPPFWSPFAHEVVRKMRAGQLLIYQGESASGCTATAEFFEEVGNEERWESIEEFATALNQVHVQFEGIHDYWHVYLKKAEEVRQ